MKLCMAKIWLYCIFSPRIISIRFSYMHFSEKNYFLKFSVPSAPKNYTFMVQKITLLYLLTLLLFGRVPQYLWSSSDLFFHYISLDPHSDFLIPTLGCASPSIPNFLGMSLSIKQRSHIIFETWLKSLQQSGACDRSIC